jgi:hypothetical protein
MNNILQGAYDLHVHTAPDVVPRKCDDLELAQRMSVAGMKGFAIKCHFAETGARAILLQKQFPKMKIVGGIALNRSVGGINPYAVERAAQIGAKIMWFPTMDAFSYQKYHHRNDVKADIKGYISLFDCYAKLKEEVYDVLDVAAKYKLVVSTGHIGASEGIAVVQAARQRGIEHVILTHADNPADSYTIEQQLQCVRMGAVVEHSYFTTLKNRTPIEEIKRQIDAVGFKNVFLTTDVGQLDSPYADVAMQEYVERLEAVGVMESAIEYMIKENPGIIIS